VGAEITGDIGSVPWLLASVQHIEPGSSAALTA
jgi:hypothetical protein